MGFDHKEDVCLALTLAGLDPIRFIPLESDMGMDPRVGSMIPRDPTAKFGLGSMIPLDLAAKTVVWIYDLVGSHG